ncbi:hypothetical protein RNJ44_00013 [Nakaseomyces bracarensis]|uniref:Uncharacterized protein n=1 Tax=Nakaseomyces bracarensis TaxID=273131 RepID=A0ABR4P0U7_9SACH
MMLNGVLWYFKWTVRLLCGWLWAVVWWIQRSIMFFVRPVVLFLATFVVAPVRIAVWNWVQFMTLPLNVFLKLTVGSTWSELLRGSGDWFSKYVAVTIFQYTASVVLLGVGLGLCCGVSLGVFHHYAGVPSYYVEIPLRFWRLPGYLFDLVWTRLRTRIPESVLRLPETLSATLAASLPPLPDEFTVAAVRSWLRVFLGLEESSLVAATSQGLPSQGLPSQGLPSPPSTPKFSPYDKGLFLRDFHTGGSGGARVSGTRVAAGPLPTVPHARTASTTTSEVANAQVRFTPRRQTLEVESLPQHLEPHSPEPVSMPHRHELLPQHHETVSLPERHESVSLPVSLPGSLPGSLSGSLPGSLPGALAGILPEQNADTSTTTANETSNVWDEFDTIPSLLDEDTDRLTTVTNRRQKQPASDVIEIRKMKP